MVEKVQVTRRKVPCLPWVKVRSWKCGETIMEESNHPRLLFPTTKNIISDHPKFVGWAEHKYFAESDPPRSYSNSDSHPVTLWHWSTNQGEPHETPLHIAFSASTQRRLDQKAEHPPKVGLDSTHQSKREKMEDLPFVACRTFSKHSLPRSLDQEWVLLHVAFLSIHQPENLSASECHPQCDYDEWWHNHRCFENIMNIMNRRKSQSPSTLLFRKALACNSTHSKAEENSIRNHQVIDI